MESARVRAERYLSAFKSRLKLQISRVNRNYFANKRNKAAEDTIRLEGALLLDCKKSVSPLWLVFVLQWQITQVLNLVWTNFTVIVKVKRQK